MWQYWCVRLQYICAFEKIFNDNRTHTHTHTHTRKRKREIKGEEDDDDDDDAEEEEEGGGTRLYNIVCMPKVACMHCPLLEEWMNEWMNCTNEWNCSLCIAISRQTRPAERMIETDACRQNKNEREGGGGADYKLWLQAVSTPKNQRIQLQSSTFDGIAS